MGLYKDGDEQQIDIIKEMAESLGGQGIKLDEILAKIKIARSEIDKLLMKRGYSARPDASPDSQSINRKISEHNLLVEQAEDALRWLLIQREACGFRTHRDVDRHYPIPARMKLLKK